MILPEIYPRSDEQIHQCLFDALIKLMQKTPIDYISIQDLVEEAHVSRSAFYRRYKDKYDLLNQSYERILEKTLFTVNQGISWREAVTKIYEVIQQNVLFFKNAFESTDDNSLKNYIFDRTMRLESEILKKAGVDPSSDRVQYRLRAYVAGGLELTVTWVKSGAVFPLEELVNIFVENVPECFKEYFI